MYHNGSDGNAAEGITDKEALLKALADENRVFTKEELAGIIQNEFFNDENPLDPVVVDAALLRIMKLDGEEATEETLQAHREVMIRKVFREILDTDKPTPH